MRKLALLFACVFACNAKFTVRIAEYENTNLALPNGYTCWNYASDYHGDNCLLNFTVAVADHEGNMYMQPSALNYQNFTPALAQNGSVYLHHAAIDFVLDDVIQAAPAAISVVVYARGSRGQGSSSNYVGKAPIQLELMDYFEIALPGPDNIHLNQGTGESLTADGKLDEVKSKIYLSYDLSYDATAYGPFGNMTCKTLDNYTDSSIQICNPMSQDTSTDSDSSNNFDGNYYCNTTNSTIKVNFVHRGQQFYKFQDVPNSQCYYCPAGVDYKANPVKCLQTESQYYNNVSYKAQRDRYRTATIVLGVFLGLALICLIALCVVIVYLRGQEDETPQRRAPPDIRPWDTTRVETQPLKSSDDEWARSPVRAAPPVPPTTYANPMSNGSTHGSSSDRSSTSLVRREAAV